MSVELRESVTKSPVVGRMEDDSSAELVIFTDVSGNETRLIKYDGILFPKPIRRSDKDIVTFHENTKKLQDLQVCPKDVLILGYPKSGMHWVHEMVGMLLNGTAETIANIKETGMLETASIDKLNSLPSPRVLNAHFWPKHLPLEVITKCKLVYLLRNPKDVVVSAHHHFHKMRIINGNFHDYLGFFLESKVPFGPWFEYVRSFEDFFETHPQLNPLIMYYEDMNKDPLDAVKKLANHLNVDYAEEFLMEIAEECHIDRMRLNNETKRHDITAHASMDGRSPMYRKGKVGDWKNWFTVAENERFEALYKEKMKGSKLEFKFVL